MTDLCTPDDVEARCLRTLTGAEEDRATVLISDASAWVRAYTRCDFTQGETTVTLRASGSVVKLPQRPVVSISQVQVRDYLGHLFPMPIYGFDGIDRIDLGSYPAVLNLPETILTDTWQWTVDVTYTHGYATVPDDVVGVVASAVAGLFNTPTAGVAGVSTQSAGPYTVGLNASAQTGRVTFTDDDRRILNRYRRGAVSAVPLR